MKDHSDPKLYRELSVPFPDMEAADKALDAFADDLSAIRKKHKISDIMCVIQVNASQGDDDGVLTFTVSFGDPLRKAAMLAQALGKEQAEFANRIAKLLKARI